jgi:cytoskeletal protein RodZ
VFDIGASLAAARETRGLSLADAERLTNIRAKHLAALEHGDFEALPGRAYARAFLRTYASALGLDADRFVAAFEEAVPEPVDETIAVVAARRRRRLRARHVLAGAVFAALVIVVAVAATSRTSRTTPPQAAPPATHAPKVLAAQHTRTTPTRVAARPATLVIRATRGARWVQVRRSDATGAVLYEGTLQQGATLRFGRVKLWLRLGAPGMVDVTRGGKVVAGVLGASPLDVTA